MKKIAVVTIALIVIILQSFLFSGCDLIRGAKRQVKSALFGIDYKVPTEADSGSKLSRSSSDSSGSSGSSGSESDADPYRNLGVDGTPVHGVRPGDSSGRPLLDLCNAYYQGPSPQMKSLLLEALGKNDAVKLLGKGKNDPDVVSCFKGLEALIEGNQEEMDTLFQIYFSVDGEVRDFVGESLAKSFDYHPDYFVMQFARKTKVQDCALLLSVSQEESTGILATRAEKLIRLKRELPESLALERAFVDSCIRGIQQGGSNSNSMSNRNGSSSEDDSGN
ncbi:MAG: hypothetical protein HQK50_03605 [Oligoflexia bacterium]|nr:hypothetical protein [Oligoflexia bacterium]MBF0364629.1 hypothetical protein [Oligoflexia bacterium]